MSVKSVCSRGGGECQRGIEVREGEKKEKKRGRKDEGKEGRRESRC